MTTKNLLFVTGLALIISLLIIPSYSSHMLSYAQTYSGMRKSTSGRSLDVLLEPSPEAIGIKNSTKFKITFLQKDTDEVQPHIDYDFIIVKGSKEEVFKASEVAGQLRSTDNS